jgi:hypothetical protein
MNCDVSTNYGEKEIVLVFVGLYALFVVKKNIVVFIKQHLLTIFVGQNSGSVM